MTDLHAFALPPVRVGPGNAQGFPDIVVNSLGMGGDTNLFRELRRIPTRFDGTVLINFFSETFSIYRVWIRPSCDWRAEPSPYPVHC